MDYLITLEELLELPNNDVHTDWDEVLDELNVLFPEPLPALIMNTDIAGNGAGESHPVDMPSNDL